ncbi:hypothetical protein AAVH_16978 [Aphelenchoides avenae]|nr:hypothetical protein AAVH_16978 [Aphelenchus avenae]
MGWEMPDADGVEKALAAAERKRMERGDSPSSQLPRPPNDPVSDGGWEAVYRRPAGWEHTQLRSSAKETADAQRGCSGSGSKKVPAAPQPHSHVKRRESGALMGPGEEALRG